jgi:hypothetical protein
VTVATKVDTVFTVTIYPPGREPISYEGVEDVRTEPTAVYFYDATGRYVFANMIPYIVTRTEKQPGVEP